MLNSVLALCTLLALYASVLRPARPGVAERRASFEAVPWAWRRLRRLHSDAAEGGADAEDTPPAAPVQVA